LGFCALGTEFGGRHKQRGQRKADGKTHGRGENGGSRVMPHEESDLEPGQARFV
jgi:hypothetical protein